MLRTMFNKTLRFWAFFYGPGNVSNFPKMTIHFHWLHLTTLSKNAHIRAMKWWNVLLNIITRNEIPNFSNRKVSPLYIVFPEETNDIVLTHQFILQMISTRILSAIYTSGDKKEITPCHPNASHILRFTKAAELCNLTYVNSGMPWYCPKPTDVHLLCEDWHKINLNHSPPLPITQTEENIISQ